MRQADEGGRKTPSSTHRDVSLSPLKQMERLPGRDGESVESWEKGGL